MTDKQIDKLAKGGMIAAVIFAPMFYFLGLPYWWGWFIVGGICLALIIIFWRK